MNHGFVQSPTIASALFVLGLGTAGPAVYAEPARYVVEPNHTFVNFEVLHFGTSTVRARFDRTDGFVMLDREARSGRVEMEVDTTSVSSGIPAFDAHLRNADFLDTPRWPKARFVGSDFTFDGDRLTAVAGTLEMLGKTAPVTLQATRFNCYDSPVVKAPVCGGDFGTTIQRSQWGMTWGIDRGVPDAVRLLIQIEGVRK